MNWIEAAAQCNQTNQSFVLITVLTVDGSTPRDNDAKMVVAEGSCHDTIGGGQLEFQAIETAQKLLIDEQRCSHTQEYNLGQDLEQCCGGRVTLLFECFPASSFAVVLFGAGHVGNAMVSILAQLPCRVSWFDSRAECFPGTLANNIQALAMSNPEQAVEACPPDAWYFVMTHSHVLDQQLIEAILARGDSQFCGLIGSKSKAASFRSRLKKKGFSPDEMAKLTSPIGLEGVKGKTPMEIAVSAVAQMLQIRSA